MASLLLAIIYLSFISLGLPDCMLGAMMASAYIGNLSMPPLFGVFAQMISIKILPFYLLLVFTVMLLMHEWMIKKVRENRRTLHE